MQSQYEGVAKSGRVKASVLREKRRRPGLYTTKLRAAKTAHRNCQDNTRAALTQRERIDGGTLPKLAYLAVLSVGYRQLRSASTAEPLEI